MSTNGKEYKLAIRIAGIVDKSYDVALVSANSGLKSFRANMANIDGSFRELDKGFNKIMQVGKTCFHAISTAAGVAAIAIGAAVAASVKIGSEFEAEMSTVQAISGATAEELAILSEKAREVAKSTVFSATEVGSAMEYMGMAGWKAQDMVSGIDGVIALAAASGEELSMVSDIVTDSLTAMGQGADKAGHYADLMAQGAMNSNTNVELMGQTFKYAAPVAGALGYKMEDLAIATGLMASSGIKGSLSGTALRNMLTRMAKPTRESQDAMDALGLSLTDSEGRMYSLLEIMQILRQNFAEGSNVEGMQSALKDLAGLTNDQISEIQGSLGDLNEAEEAFYAAELGGQRGMSGLLAIANSTDEEFMKLTEAIYNAEGAAERMASIRLDNLQGDVTILKDTMSDAGIELYYQFNNELRGIVQDVTEFAGSMTNKIPSAFRKISTEFPTLRRKFKQFAEPVFNGIVNSGKWIIQHGRGITSILTGIGAALAAYKIASNTSHLITSIMKLMSMGPTGFAIIGITAAIAALTTAIAAYKQHEKALVDNSLSDHFGSLTLSMQELQRVAEYIVSTDNLGTIQKAMEAFGGLDEYRQTINDTVSELNKMNWMVSIGMELDADDQESYQKAIQNYVEAAQNYAVQGRYAVSLNLSAVFDMEDLEQSNIVSQIDLFYSDKYDELQELGTQLNEAVTEAFNDGLLEIDEVEKIQQIQKQMAEVEKALALGEYDAALSSVVTEFNGLGNLAADSFQNLQEAMSQVVNEASDTIRESYKKNQASTNAAYKAGYLTDEQYAAASEQNSSEMLSEISRINIQGIRAEIDAIYGNYSEEIAQYQQAVQDILSEYSQDSYAQDWKNRPVIMWEGIIQELEKAGPADADKKAVETLLEAMSEQIEEINSLMGQWETLTPETQAELSAVQQDLATLRGMTARRGDNILGWGTSGDLKGLYQDVMNQVESSDSYGNIKGWVDQYYEEYTGYSYKRAKAAAETAASDTQNLINESFASGFDVSANVRVRLTPQITNSPFDSITNSPFDSAGNLTGPYSNSYIEGWQTANRVATGIDHNATGGIIQNKELSWLAENGPEAVVPLDGSRRAVSLWKKAGQLLGMESILDTYDVSGGGQTITIDYNPTLKFYGEAPSRQDLDDSLRLSQDDFDSMMERYLKTNGRVSFA